MAPLLSYVGSPVLLECAYIFGQAVILKTLLLRFVDGKGPSNNDS